MRKMILVDGNNLIYRAYYATAYSGNLMRNANGLFTNAIYGFHNMINKIVSNEVGTDILIAFDAGKETFRHSEYKEYKAGRKPMPDEFRVQLPYIRKYLELNNITHYELPMYEADDIIGTFSSKYYEDYDEIVIYSNDKDLLQLINDKVKIVSSSKSGDYIVDEEYLFDNMGVTPDQIIDLKGLMGDASDNLKGIPGVGEKTAVKLLKEYKTLENLFDNVDLIKGKLKEKIENNKESAIMCKNIATIDLDAPVTITIEDIGYKKVVNDDLIAFYQDLGFHSILNKLNVESKPVTAIEYSVINSDDDVLSILENDSSIILEYFGSNYHKSEKLGFAISNKKGNFFLPYKMIHESISFQLWLIDSTIKKRTYDYKAMRVQLLYDGYDIHGVEFDLLLATYLINPNLGKEEFKRVAMSFNFDDVEYDERVYNKGVKYCIPEDKSIYELHACKKANALNKMYNKVNTKLSKDSLDSLLYDIEIPLAKTLAKMEFEGLNVDKEQLVAQDEKIAKTIDKLTENIFELAGCKFNISSPKQLGEILFEKLELKTSKKTKNGYSTNIDVLNSLIDAHPIIKQVIEYRKFVKLKNTYIDGLLLQIYDDSKVHTIYKQALTQTGRLSSIEPNLQNIPIRYEEGRMIRKAFVASKDSILLAADYSQIELRILAHLSKDEELINAFNNNEDIHKRTAQLIFGKEEISSIERRQAKVVNFGIIYGMSSYALSEDLNISFFEADKFIKNYYDSFPKIEAYLKSIVDTANELGYVSTLLGRRRYIPELKSSVYMQREAGKRNAMNAPIQGSAADIIKIAMIKIDEAIKEKLLNSKLLIQIHDELVFDVPNDEKDIMLKLVKDVMENCYKIDVPLTVDIGYGPSLYDTK